MSLRKNKWRNTVADGGEAGRGDGRCRRPRGGCFTFSTLLQKEEEQDEAAAAEHATTTCGGTTVNPDDVTKESDTL